jgi:hypothetical protein
VIAHTEDLDKGEIYPKEWALIKEIKSQLARGRKCQVLAVYTNKHDETARLENLLRGQGICTAVLRVISAHKRAAWYGEQLGRGIDVAICHPSWWRPDWIMWNKTLDVRGKPSPRFFLWNEFEDGVLIGLESTSWVWVAATEASRAQGSAPILRGRTLITAPRECSRTKPSSSLHVCLRAEEATLLAGCFCWKWLILQAAAILTIRPVV